MSSDLVAVRACSRLKGRGGAGPAAEGGTGRKETACRPTLPVERLLRPHGPNQNICVEKSQLRRIRHGCITAQASALIYTSADDVEPVVMSVWSQRSARACNCARYAAALWCDLHPVFTARGPSSSVMV